MEELDFAGPYEIFGKAAEKENGTIHTVASTPTVRCRHNLHIERTKTLQEDPGPLLVVPGGNGARTPGKERAVLAEYIYSSFSARSYILSVCTGTFLLAEAQILFQKTVTTHRAFLSPLKEVKGVKTADYRIVKDGNLITCQGVTSGIDGALFTVSLIYGRKTAREIIERIEYPVSLETILKAAHIVD